MNRKERRKVAKKLGLMEFKNKLSFSKRMDLIKENVEAGIKKQEQMKENMMVYEQQYDDDKQSSVIYNLAVNIALNKKIPIIDAMAEAKLKYEEMKK